MPLDKTDLRKIKEVVVEAVDPYFTAIQKDFDHVHGRLDRIENLMIADHKKRIEHEKEVRELKERFAL